MVDLLAPLLIFGIVYLMILKPQADEQERHKEVLQSLKKDDKVITKGGLYGRVHAVSEQTIVLDLGEKMRVTIEKAFVDRLQDDATENKG